MNCEKVIKVLKFKLKVIDLCDFTILITTNIVAIGILNELMSSPYQTCYNILWKVKGKNISIITYIFLYDVIKWGDSFFSKK